MDNLKFLLLTNAGRISRKQWWIGSICLFVISAILSIVLGSVVSNSPVAMAWLAVVVNLVLIYPSYCLSVKRRHDRNSDGKDVLIFLALSALVNVIQTSVLSGAAQGNLDMMTHTPPLWVGLVSLAIAVYAIYLFILLGFLKGTQGPNTYGLDPLDGAA